MEIRRRHIGGLLLRMIRAHAAARIRRISRERIETVCPFG